MLIAVERLLQSKKWRMLTVVTAIMLISNYYFAFKTAILSAVYILIRILPHLRRERGGIGRVLREGFALLGACCLGALLSAVVLVPVGIAFLDSSRSTVYGGYSASLFHYEWTHYAKIFLSFCAPGVTVGCWTFMGFSPLVLAALLDLYAPRREGMMPARKMLRNGLRVALILTALFLCIPLCGKIFNGFSYVTNRWSYGFSFAMSAAVALWFLRFESGEDVSFRKQGVCMLLYALVQLAAAAHFGWKMLVGAASVAAFGALLVWCGRRMQKKRETVVRICVGLTALCCAINAFVTAATQDGFKKQNVLAQIQASPAGEVELAQQGFYRLDTGMDTDNHAPLLDYYGTGFYWSVIPDWVSRYYQDLQLGSLAFSYRLNALGGDSALLALSSTKYSVRNEQQNTVLPYGAELVSEGQGARLYRNPYALDLGYVYHAQLSQSEYAALNPLEKRMALLGCAVVPDGEALNLPVYQSAVEIESADWTLQAADGAVLESERLRGKAGDSVTLQFKRGQDAESYLCFADCEAAYSDGQVAALEAIASTGTNLMAVANRASNFYFEQQGICTSLGSGNGQTDTVTLRFWEDGDIRFSDLRIYNLPMRAYRAQLEELKKESLRGVQLGNNRVTGSVKLESDGVLQIAVPYGKGWTARVDGKAARVDGKAARLMRCGGMYMGVALDAGEHHLELRYCTPGLKAGAVISAAALTLLLALSILDGWRRKKFAAKF